jgi:hypothetical protein
MMEGKKLGGTSMRTGPWGYIKKRSEGDSVATDGDTVGALVLVGLRVGGKGFSVGSHVGCSVSVGKDVGWTLGLKEGAAVGAFEGDDVGFEVGLGLSGEVLSEATGAADFDVDFGATGTLVGLCDVGFLVGVKESEGLLVEGLLVEGLRVGFLTGAFVKNAVGIALGDAAFENVGRMKS